MAIPPEIVEGLLILPIAGIALSFCIEQLLRPRPQWRARRWSGYLIHVGAWLLLYGVGLAVWQRPYFASGLNLAGLLLIVFVSNAKFASLREPFLLSDFRFFKALLQHPRLYLPFFGRLPAVAAALVFVGFCVFALRLEPSVPSLWGSHAFVLSCGACVVGGGVLIWLGAIDSAPITLDPHADVQAFGLIGSFVRYWQEERANDPGTLATNLPTPLPGAANGPAATPQPHIVAVQCESFFDARRVYAGINPAVFTQFDALGSAAAWSGRLNVPAWGANTVRTEFSFLSGIAPAALGVHQFNPYRKLARSGVPTIASVLKQRGYRTICVHPFAATFYDRDVVFPKLGFDDFIDISVFADADKSGPYVGDAAVANKVRSLLDAAAEPLFIFVITMENHGPLHEEKVAEGDIGRLYATPPPAGYDEFT
ncbi:MAG: sulfatase-like hydrolase/transferase, partial [Usitatibacteraceae bacterium]